MGTTYPVERVPSDDCAVIHQKQLYYPHKGQWVDVVRVGQSLQEMTLEMEARHVSNELEVMRSDLMDKRQVYEAAKSRGDAESATVAEKEWEQIYEKREAFLRGHYNRFAEYVADHIVDWNWTGRNGKALPRPDGTTGPIMRLLPEEINYLQEVIRQDNPLPESAGESASRTSSSDSASQPTNQDQDHTLEPSLIA